MANVTYSYYLHPKKVFTNVKLLIARRSTRFTLRRSLTCLILNLCIEMFDMLILVPTVAVLEMALCHNHSSINSAAIISLSGTVETKLCKTKAVQQQLMLFRSWKAFFDALSSNIAVLQVPQMSLTYKVILAAIPLGYIADKLGRKEVLASSIFGSLAGTLWTLLVCMLPSHHHFSWSNPVNRQA